MRSAVLLKSTVEVLRRLAALLWDYDTLFVAGGVPIVIGVRAIYAPAGWIVAGILLMVWAYIGAAGRVKS